tara:strand:- start:1719 stop:2327 length:609 start_codon:yes stop_codon:yes gene_type:complete
MISLSEIDTTAKRASRSIGFSWGISEEIGKNTKLSELFGIKGVKNLIKYLEIYKTKQFQNISVISQNNKSSIPYCPIMLGVNFLDQIHLISDLKYLEIENVSFPLLFLPFVSRSSEIIGKKININIDKFQFLLNFNQSIFFKGENLEIIENAKNISINILENENSFNSEDWAKLYKLSENTFVEETDRLKENAAGAGFTDND